MVAVAVAVVVVFFLSRLLANRFHLEKTTCVFFPDADGCWDCRCFGQSAGKLRMMIFWMKGSETKDQLAEKNHHHLFFFSNMYIYNYIIYIYGIVHGAKPTNKSLQISCPIF